MSPSTASPRLEPSLADLWRRLARRASDTQLALCAAVCPLLVVAAIVMVFVNPLWAARWWPASAAPLMVAAFGMWGIADRELAPAEHASRGPRWARPVRAVAVLLALVAGAIAVLWLLTHVVGTWIS